MKKDATMKRAEKKPTIQEALEEALRQAIARGDGKDIALTTQALVQARQAGL